jgi:hypothetical protein
MVTQLLNKFLVLVEMQNIILAHVTETTTERITLIWSTGELFTMLLLHMH